MVVRYETGVPIGSGGMGTVVRSYDPVLERHVALKLLRRDEPELAERMLREARAQAAVDHPNVAKVYEVGYLEDGRPFIAMQLIEGRPLDEVAPGLTVDQKIGLVVTVAEAVQAAHATGLVHRDLKPSNILVEESGEWGLVPFVVDFGIAREEAAPGLTVSGQVLGTPGYMAPEQASGAVHTLDRRADIFSLGVILYELVGGCQPFGGDSAVEKLVSLLNDDPAPLRTRVPSVPADLEAVIFKCLEKRPEHRYVSARALAEDLRRYLAGEPVLARRVTRLGILWRRARRHPVVAATVAIAALAVAVAGDGRDHLRGDDPPPDAGSPRAGPARLPRRGGDAGRAPAAPARPGPGEGPGAPGDERGPPRHGALPGGGPRGRALRPGAGPPRPRGAGRGTPRAR
ncbi:MAG: serine/threonine-protein kinase [Thermoanaerobaculaceae bacterium]